MKAVNVQLYCIQCSVSKNSPLELNKLEKFSSNNCDHSKMQQEPQKRRRGRRGGRGKGKQNENQDAETLMIKCPFCPNKMPASSIFGEYSRKNYAENRMNCTKMNDVRIFEISKFVHFPSPTR